MMNHNFGSIEETIILAVDNYLVKLIFREIMKQSKMFIFSYVLYIF